MNILYVPLTLDPQLKSLLQELSEITTKTEFNRWRTSFLNRYESFLGTDGVGQAEEQYPKYTTKLNTWYNKLVHKVEQDIETGNITIEHSTAMARTRLLEFKKQTDLIAQATFELTPILGVMVRHELYQDSPVCLGGWHHCCS